MSDKELLEKAAKAAGIFLSRETLAEKLPNWEWDDEFDSYHLPDGGMRGSVIWYGSDGDIGGTEGLDWNPLTDDGDALRLAVKLGIDLTILENEVIADVPNASCDRCIEQVWLSSDMYAATRRCIVRAAASIGPTP